MFGQPKPESEPDANNATCVVFLFLFWACHGRGSDVSGFELGSLTKLRGSLTGLCVLLFGTGNSCRRTRAQTTNCPEEAWLGCSVGRREHRGWGWGNWGSERCGAAGKSHLSHVLKTRVDEGKGQSLPKIVADLRLSS